MQSRLLLVTLLTGLLLVRSQTPDGQITGRISDTAGARIPKAAVTAVNVATGVKTATVTNEEGNYRLRNLIPGVYRLEAEAPGFKRFVRQPIEVRVGDILTIDVGLELGAVTESITVTAEAPLLEAASSSLGKVVDNRRIMDLPVPGGSVFYLMQMTPGVISTASPTNLYNANEMGPPPAWPSRARAAVPPSSTSTATPS